MGLLESDQIESHFAKLPLHWSLVGGAELELDKEFPDFASALAFVNKVGALAEEQNHHPDIQLGWGSVKLNITTHSVGGLTKKDFDFAKAVEEIED